MNFLELIFYLLSHLYVLLQVLQGHSPFKNLLKRFENELIIATGKGEPALVMSEYGFKNVLSLDEYASYFENIDPVLNIRDGQQGRYLIGIVTHCQYIIFLLKE